MRSEITDNELNQVVGGCVNLSETKNKIGFDTIGEGYTLKCAFKDARSYLMQLYAEYPDKDEKEFDILVRDKFRAKGWI